MFFLVLYCWCFLVVCLVWMLYLGNLWFCCFIFAVVFVVVGLLFGWCLW